MLKTEHENNPNDLIYPSSWFVNLILSLITKIALFLVKTMLSDGENYWHLKWTYAAAKFK